MTKRRIPTHAERLSYILEDGEWHTSAELYRRSMSIVHSRIADLRRRGWTIECERVAGAEGAKAYRYRATGRPA